MYIISSRSPTNMADKGNSCFWLATVKIIYSSETAWPNGVELGRKHLCKVLYKVSSFRSVWPTNMAAKSNSCFWLANVKKIFSSETAWPNGAKLYRKHLCKVLYKVSSFRSVWRTHGCREQFLLRFNDFVKFASHFHEQVCFSITVRDLSSIFVLCIHCEVYMSVCQVSLDLDLIFTSSDLHYIFMSKFVSQLL